MEINDLEDIWNELQGLTDNLQILSEGIMHTGDELMQSRAVAVIANRQQELCNKIKEMIDRE